MDKYYETEKTRRTRKQMEAGGSPEYLRNERVKAGIRDRFRQFVMSYTNKGQEVSFSEVRYTVADWRHNKEKVSLTVVHQLIEEMQDEGMIIKELSGNSFYLKPTQRGGLDEIYAPIFKPTVKPTLIQVDLIMGHTRGGYGKTVNRGYRSYWESVDWPGAW